MRQGGSAGQALDGLRTCGMVEVRRWIGGLGQRGTPGHMRACRSMFARRRPTRKGFAAKLLTCMLEFFGACAWRFAAPPAALGLRSSPAW